MCLQSIINSITCWVQAMNVFIINYQQYNMLGISNACVYNQLSTVEHAGYKQ